MTASDVLTAPLAGVVTISMYNCVVVP